MSGYVELHCHSCFSLLDGASTPEALVERAAELGMPALALTDHDGLYGAVRFGVAARERGIHPIFGAEVTLTGGSHLVLLAEDRAGWGNLCHLLSRAQLEGSKGQARLNLKWLRGRTEGLIALTGCRMGRVASLLLADEKDKAVAALRTLKSLFGSRNLYVELQHHYHPEDALLIADLAELAVTLRLPIVATHNVHYARREGHRLHDVLTAIRHNVLLQEAQKYLRPNSEYFLQSPGEMVHRFAAYPGALDNALEIAHRCKAEIGFRGEALPPEPDEADPDLRLAELCRAALAARYQRNADGARRQLEHELRIIRDTHLAGYFLLVWDIVRFAKDRGILVRGRGSAANSIAAYLLGITNVDPLAHNLLFERFLSAEARVMPDIDLDFCARRREEVIQYVYERYGASHVGMVCNYVTYQERSAVRDVGKALGLPPDTIDLLAKSHRGRWGDAVTAPMPEGVSSGVWEPFGALCEQIHGLPRHLSIHVGGMCITAKPLDEVVPLERATMPGRVVIQWDKDSLEDAGLIKLDILSLRTLSAIDECLRLVERNHGVRIDLDALPLDDPAVYDALQRADTVGAFQVESRAQQQALVKMKPRCFRDIVVEVAIIRPGPLLGNMVHPFFRRRQGLERVTYAHPMLRPILEETLGVIVFQEQVIRVAMAMGRLSAGEADLLRRAMSRHRSDEEMAAFRERFVTGALSQGVGRETAETVFAQLAGFASYGFCKSHAAAFAKTAYDTMYLRAHFPTEYTCALLNHQPMGFYAPRVLVGDAKRHGVRVLPVHANRSESHCTTEGGAIRLGLAYVDGMGEAAMDRVLSARPEDGFAGLSDFCRRTGLPRTLVERIILAGGMEDWNSDRRALLWELGRLRYQQEELPIALPSDGVSLEPMTDAEELGAEYDTTGLSANGHWMEVYRDRLDAAGVLTSRKLQRAQAGSRVSVAGMVVVRQAPPTAKGFVFLTLEDEWGLINVIVRPDVFQAQREVWAGSLVLVVEGTVQRGGGVVNVMAEAAGKTR
jgi:error-prone DNA polymerase